MLAMYCALAGVSIYTGWSQLVFVWLLPALVGQPFLRIFLLAEHGHCALVENVFDNTRTTYTLRVVRMFAWNMPFHAEHHAYPSVPFFRLPELHELMQKYLVEKEKGYIRFNKKYLKKMHSA